MHKTKKKTKTAKLPKPIKVKKEKSDEDRLPQPMTHYLDDRLEMVKQIFNTLKPKTIINLAPEFLKTQALEDIEEACLNELLCISTKRLKSIITATKCPTDTESSDNDSDVERHEEHISLEEISSDSEIEGSSSKKAKRKKTTKSTEETTANKKDNSNDDNQEDGQISVLELLELQARARAIRSQLALEPVTKIEVDSDEEKRKGEKDRTSKKDDTTSRNERKRSIEKETKRDSSKTIRSNDQTIEKETEKRVTKKIKLKRSYRNSANNEKGDESRERGNSEKEVKDTNENPFTKDNLKESEKIKNKESVSVKEIKKEKKSRSPSPDVIPIVAEPETLLITDSSDEDHTKTNKNTSDVNEKNKTVSAQSDVVKEKESKTNEKESEKPNEKTEQLIQQESKGGKTEQTDQEQEKIISENAQDSETKIMEKNDTDDGNKAKIQQTKNSLNKKSNNETNSNNNSDDHDDDQNDDVISLGGDLENEMNEELEKEVNARQSPYNKKTTEDSSQDNNKSQDESQTEDVISLESSEDERTDDNQSWHSRYMKSSKVSKVLAASRLGKRVRDKIKNSKHLKKDAHHENTDADKEKSPVKFTSKHEDGSVEQYKELLEMRQRKQS